MDTQNHFYGHTAALAAYAGLSRPRHVAGLIQHGWTTVPPIPVNFGDFPDVEKDGRRTLFVWSHGSRAWDPAMSPRRSFALGAPWAYLVSTGAVQRQLTGGQGAGTLIMPLHSTRIVEVRGDQTGLAQQYLRSEGPSTVCLHSEDIHKPEIVGSWKDAGHRVVTAGPRHDPDFLSRILALVLASERVVANRLMTPVLYAASLGRDVAVYGDPLSLSTAEIHGQDAIASLWPELHGASLDRAVTTELARTELGFQHLLEPSELRSALGWSRRSASPAVQYWAGAPIRKTMNVVGLGQRDPGSSEKQVGASPMAWLRHPMSHLPRPLPAHAAAVDPLPAAIPVSPVRAAR
ncbi:MAG: hypothetical protein ABI862_08295 [Ilumatobacteraceae bacterium]